MKAKHLAPKAIGKKIPVFSDKPQREDNGQKMATSEVPIRQNKQLAGTTL